MWPLNQGDWVVQVQNVAGLSGNKQLLPADNSRWAIIWGNPASIPYRFTPDPTAAPSVGIRQLNSTNPIMMNARDYGPLIGQAWYAASEGAATGFTLIDLLYRPRGSQPTEVAGEGADGTTCT
jgi:hypothetical protein